MTRSATISILLMCLLAPGMADTLATEEQALKVTLPKATSIAPETRALTTTQRDQLQKQTGLRFPEKEHRFFVGSAEGKATGYAVEMNEVGKHEYITFMVGITPEGKVGDVIVMQYREARGGEVKEQRFLRQFHGKQLKDPLKVNQDIVNYTGATLSSHAIARGVKKALALVNLFYGSGQ